MIQYVEHKNINMQKWDACIHSSSNATVFVYSWYLDVAYKNWSALIINDYEAVFPLAIQSKLGIKYTFQPFFTRYFGLFYGNKINSKLLTNCLEYISNEFKYAEFCLHESQTETTLPFQIKEKKYQFLDLNTEFTSLQKVFSTNAKRSIKKSEKAAFKLIHKINPKEIVDLFKKTKGAELAIFKPKDYQVLIKLMETCIQQKKGIIYAVTDKTNNLIAAAFFIKNNNRFIFLKSGVTEFGKENGAMHYLFNEFIKENANTNTLLDFGGSSVDSVARFYKNFGAKDCVCLQILTTNFSFFLNKSLPLSL